MNKLQLTIAIQSNWHLGSGEESGAYADALVLKNHQGLPYLPGKSLKGLLRDAMIMAVKNQWFDPAEIDHLFGQEGQALNTQGQLIISSGQLSESEQSYFAHYPAAKKSLFQVVYSTAIDGKTGAAKNRSLRAIEMAVPMTLYATIEVRDETENQALHIIEKIAPLISHIGSKRFRGAGEVIISTGIVEGEK